MGEKVSFRYRVGQIVYFMYKYHPHKSYIQEININIKRIYMDDYNSGYIVCPEITYKIKGVWFKEDELFDDVKFFKEMYHLD